MKKIFCVLCLLICTQMGWAAEPLRIGFIGPMTGNFSQVGMEATRVLTLLAEDINSQGGLMGRKVELLFEDDGGNPQTATAAGEKLLRQSPVAVIGSQTSTVTESLQNIFNDRKVIHISYGATAVSLTQKGHRYFFRTCPQNVEQAKATVKIIQKMKVKKVALLHDDSLYGKDLADVMRSRLHNWMIDIVYDGSLKAGEPDYLPLVERVKATGPELVFFTGYYPEAARILLARNRLNWNIPFMSGDGANDSDLVKIAGKKAAAGFSFISPLAPEDLRSPRAMSFLDRYMKAYGTKLTSIYALFAGDAFIAVTESIRRVQTTDPDRISDYLHRSYFNQATLTGKQYFDYKGDVMNDIHGLYKVDNEGRFILQNLLVYGQVGQ
ncbi:MAG: branched-chain amino acid ABC transporter substrate-binding protein [Syntrophaceae bacterium]